MNHQTEISLLFKSEYSNLVAVLCRYYGVQSIEIAEDIVSDTFVQAMKSWSHHAIPDRPKAWLRKVALNKIKDQYRRSKIFEEKVMPNISMYDLSTEETICDEIVEDSQLKMMFVVCHSSLNQDAQMCLALRLLCGFSIDEISIALLSNKETINKKLYRAKKKLKEDHSFLNDLDMKDYCNRLDNVLHILYLLFNEGYYSSISQKSIREDLCWEAMRLLLLLEKQKEFTQSKIHALLALMCFHVSRFEARLNGVGDYVLLEDQDRSLWNFQLIHKGKKYLSLSIDNEVKSKYHLEAAVAYWHTTDAEGKWNNILQLYNKLLTIEYSPIIALNRTYALARANSVDQALEEAIKLALEDNHLYLSLLAELYRMKGDLVSEKNYLELAYTKARKESERNLLKKKIHQSQDQ